MLVGNAADVHVYCNFVHQGLLTFRDVRRNLNISISKADPAHLTSFLESIRQRLSPGAKKTARDHNCQGHLESPTKSPQSKRSKLRIQSKDNLDSSDVDSHLSNEQREAVKMALSGVSFFLTGGAGTGKSLVLNEIIKALPKSTTFVTGFDFEALCLQGLFHQLLELSALGCAASTGIAACNINGTTLHQFAGLGKSEQSPEEIAKMVERKDAGQRWRIATTLIIDEISMVSAADFDRLSRLGQLLRRDPRPFGGLQVAPVRLDTRLSRIHDSDTRLSHFKKRPAPVSESHAARVKSRRRARRHSRRPPLAQGGRSPRSSRVRLPPPPSASRSGRVRLPPPPSASLRLPLRPRPPPSTSRSGRVRLP
jgi:hypothetical protein